MGKSALAALRGLRRSTWIVVVGVAALLLVGGVSLDAVSLRDAELVSGDLVPFVDEFATTSTLPESASTDGLICGYVECEVELIVTKRAESSTKGAPGGLVHYHIDVEVPSGSPGPVIIDSVVDDAFGVLTSPDCSLVGKEIAPGDEEDCNIEPVLPELEAGQSHTNTVTVKGHVVGTNIQAGGQDSATVDIADQQLDIELKFTIVGTLADCALDVGDATSVTVNTGTPLRLCVKVTNVGNTELVDYEQTFLGVTTNTPAYTPWPQAQTKRIVAFQSAVDGTTVYTYKVVVIDEWGNTETETADVTIIGVPAP